VITNNYLVMGIGLVVCWSTSNHQKRSFLVLWGGISNLLEMLLFAQAGCAGSNDVGN
jgi:hypothetical protein